MKENLIKSLTRKQLEKVCGKNELSTKGSRTSLEANVLELSYNTIVKSLKDE